MTALVEGTCDVCGEEFPPSPSTTRYICDECLSNIFFMDVLNECFEEDDMNKVDWKEEGF